MFASLSTMTIHSCSREGESLFFCSVVPGDDGVAWIGKGRKKDKAGEIDASESPMTHPQEQRRAALLKDM